MSKNKKLYICVTDGCNLACKGCYKYLLSVIKPKFLDLDTVREQLNKFIVTRVDETLDVTFHGGEPFYIGDLQSYIDLVKEYDYDYINWNATTNLVYNITDKHLELFHLFHDFLKTSWDVDDYRFKNESQRITWESNVKLLLDNNITIQPIITVNTQTIKHDPNEIYDYMYNLGIRDLNFERITVAGRATFNNIRPTNREVDDWLYRAYKANKYFIIPIFEELNSYKIGYVGCRRRECMLDVKTLNTDGSLGLCPNCSNNKDFTSLIYNEKHVNEKCYMCKFFKICHGECSQLIWDETGCPGLTKILEEIS